MNKLIIKSIYVQFLTFLLNIGIQILAIPILLKYWGVEYYGEWLVIFSIPSYLGMSDLGLGTAATTEISLLIAENNFQKANKLLNSSFYFIQIIGFVLFTLLLIILYALPLHEFLSLHKINNPDFKICFILLSVYIYLALVITLPQGLYRVIGEFPRGQIISTIFRFFEFTLFFLVIILGGDCILAALSFLAVRILYVLFIFFDIKSKAKWIIFSSPHINFSIVNPVLKPSLSLMAITAGQAILGQGLITVIGTRGNSSDVVTFSAARTLVNFSKQIIGFLNLSFWGELTIAFAKKNNKYFIELITRLNQINFIFTIFGSIFLYFFGTSIIKIWTNGEINIDIIFFNCLILYIIFDNIWSSNWTMLMSINKHLLTVIPFLISSIFTILIIYAFLPTFGLSIIPLSLIFSDIIMIIVVFKMTANILLITIKDLFKTLIKIY